ncbi:MAG: hypothetical protein ACYDH4_10730 [Candidatus Cryosericum sp.]
MKGTTQARDRALYNLWRSDGRKREGAVSIGEVSSAESIRHDGLLDEYGNLTPEGLQLREAAKNRLDLKRAEGEVRSWRKILAPLIEATGTYNPNSAFGRRLAKAEAEVHRLKETKVSRTR